jgi:hypothetical protein
MLSPLAFAQVWVVAEGNVCGAPLPGCCGPVGAPPGLRAKGLPGRGQALLFSVPWKRGRLASRGQAAAASPLDRG